MADIDGGEVDESTISILVKENRKKMDRISENPKEVTPRRRRAHTRKASAVKSLVTPVPCLLAAEILRVRQ